MRSAPRRHKTTRPRLTWIGTAVLLLLAICTSCRDDTTEPLASPQSPNVTIAAPVCVVKDNPADVAPRPAEIDSGPAGLQSVARNPLGGCDMCHVDVEDEFVGTMHDAEGVGCVKCHGPSEGHIADENNDVLPDHVFAREEVDSFCRECHECSRPMAREPAAVPPAKQKVCTECHGVHDLRLTGEAGSGPGVEPQSL